MKWVNKLVRLRVPLWYVLSELVRKRIEVSELRGFARAKGLLALTYDDGPSSCLTHSIAKLLCQHNVRATFFMLGSRAIAAPVVVDRVYDMGHEIGCHGSAHLHGWKVPADEWYYDIERGYRQLGVWISKSAVCRPPYGKLPPGGRGVAMKSWGPLCWWTIDAGDTHVKLPKVQAIIDRVINEGGGVVLMHDSERTCREADLKHQFVLELTKALLRTASEQGFEVVTLGELLALRMRYSSERGCK